MLVNYRVQVRAVKHMAEMNQGNEPPEHYLGRGKDGLLTYDRFTTLRRTRTTTDCLSEQYIATGLCYDRCCVTLLSSSSS